MQSRVAFCLMIVGGCVASQDMSVNMDEFGQKESKRQSMFDFSCPPPRPRCEEKFDPQMCSFKSYQGRELLVWQKPVAWGENSCLSLQALSQKVCELSLSPKLVSEVECIPDASLGVCAQERETCLTAKSESPQKEPVYCEATAYQGQTLSLDQKIAGWGRDRCLAEANLRQNACKSNLNPANLGQISCYLEPRMVECIEKKVSCRDLIKKTVCQGVLKKSDKKVEAVADSECAAREALFYQACYDRKAPSELKDISCR